MGRCGEIMTFTADPALFPELDWKLNAAHFCQQRLCPLCEWRRARAWSARMTTGMAKFKVEHPTHVPLLATFTVRNCSIHTLGQTINDMHKAWGRLHQCAFWPIPYWMRRTEVTVGQPAPADGLPVARVKKGRLPSSTGSDAADSGDPAVTKRNVATIGGLWAHPHIHALLLVPASYWAGGYIKQSEWVAQWQMAARLDYQPIVDIRRAYDPRRKEDKEAGIEAAILEVTKYITKANDISALGPHAPEFFMQLRRHRMTQLSYGLSKYVRDGDVGYEEMIDVHPTKEQFLQWLSATYRWCYRAEDYYLAS
jgi:hypothetical protein